MSDVPTVTHLDLSRYLGTWFEICRLPMKWEDETAKDITATYSLNDDGSIKVDNRCINAEGQPTQSIGQASLQGEDPARLAVSFLPEMLRWIPFTKGDYWVLKLDPEYQISLVGGPDRKFLWLLARAHALPAAVKQGYLDHAISIGYDLSGLIHPSQSGAQVTEDQIAAAKR